MIGTTTDVLTDLFRGAIIAITPRIMFKGAEGWKPYGRETSTIGPTRTFRFGWSAGNIHVPGIFTDGVVEMDAEMRVRTDYQGNHDEMQHAIIEDFHQLHETLSALKSTSNGLMLVEAIGPQYRDGDEEDDIAVVDHTFNVRYLRTR